MKASLGGYSIETVKVSDRVFKVSMDSLLIVPDILQKCKDLKRSAFSYVYLKPDRTLEQRLKHRTIVAELKKKLQKKAYHQK